VSKLVASSLVALVLVACGGRERDDVERGAARRSSEPSASTAMETALPPGISRVADVSEVCMVNNQFMGRPQIPVEVDGKTYFGCCEMCRARIAEDPTVRTAQDPVTGEPVDKASAIIVQDASGKVLYFASEDTLRRYRG
jgi:YHS domain-containing protein